MRRTVLTIATIAVLVLAGCGGGGGSGTTALGPSDGSSPDGTAGGTTAATTPTDDTTAPDGVTTAPSDGGTTVPGTGTAPPGDETATPADPDAIDLPPGITDGDLTDAAALADAHAAVLDADGGTQYLGWRRTDTDRRRLWTSEFGADGRTLALRQGDDVTRYWTDGETVTRGIEHDEGERRTLATGTTTLGGELGEALRRNDDQVETYLGIGHWTVEDRTVRDGRAVVVLNATGVDVEGVIDTGFEDEDRDLVGLTGTAYVTEDGLITEMTVDARMRYANNKTEYTDQFRATTTNVGSTTAAPPDWYDDVPRADAAYVADGRALELTRTGGAALQWTTELAVYREGDGDTPSGTVEVPDTLRGDDSLYVYAVDGGSVPEFRATTDRSAIPDDAIDLSSRGEIRVEGTYDGIEFVYATDEA